MFSTGLYQLFYYFRLCQAQVQLKMIVVNKPFKSNSNCDVVVEKYESDVMSIDFDQINNTGTGC